MKDNDNKRELPLKTVFDRITVGRPFGGETYLTFPTAIEIGTKHGDTLSYNQFEKVFGVQSDFID